MAEAPPLPQRHTDHRVFLGFAVVRVLADGTRRLRVRWLRLISVGLVAVGASWLLGALAFYLYFKINRHFEEVRYADMLTVPWHWAEHQRRLGEYHLRMGDEHFKAGRYQEARQSFNLAVIKLPENLHAKQMLAWFSMQDYAYSKDEISLDSALHLLETGVPFALDDPDYLNDYLHRLVQWHREAKAITTCQDLLKQNPANPKVTLLLALNLADLLTGQGKYDEAGVVIEHYKLTDTLEGTMLAGKLLWERGKRRAAIDYLEQMLKRYQGADPLYAMLASYYRDMGDLDKARQYILMRELNAPMSVMPRIDMLYLLAKSGDKDRVEKDANTILDQFANDPNALAVLANFATDQGNVDLSLRIYNRAVENHFDLSAYSFMLIESYLTAHDYDRALKFIDDIDQEKPAWLEQRKPILDSLRAVAYYGQGNSDRANVFLARILKANFPHVETIVAIANRFQQMGGYEEAQEILLTAIRRDPDNQLALVQLVNVDLQLGSSTNLEANLRRIMHSRRPPLDLIMDAYKKLGSDRFIFVPDRQSLLDEMSHFIENAAAKRQAVEL